MSTWMWIRMRRAHQRKIASWCAWCVEAIYRPVASNQIHNHKNTIAAAIEFYFDFYLNWPRQKRSFYAATHINYSQTHESQYSADNLQRNVMELQHCLASIVYRRCGIRAGQLFLARDTAMTHSVHLLALREHFKSMKQNPLCWYTKKGGAFECRSTDRPPLWV